MAFHPHHKCSFTTVYDAHRLAAVASSATKACGGGLVGGLVGLVPAVFTFGLSIPIGLSAAVGETSWTGETSVVRRRVQCC